MCIRDSHQNAGFGIGFGHRDSSSQNDSTQKQNAPAFQQAHGVCAVSYTHLPDAVLNKPFHHEGRFVSDTPDTVKHEHKQNIEFSLFGALLDDCSRGTGGRRVRA